MILFRSFLQFLVLQTFLFGAEAPAKTSQYLYLDAPSKKHGLFCLFNFVAGVLSEYEAGNYAGIEVNFEQSCAYYNKSRGSNCWQYYCEPILLGSRKDAALKRFDSQEFGDYALRGRSLRREEVSRIIEKYIKINRAIKNKVRAFLMQHYLNQHVIAVHYRGTDKISEAPRVPYSKVIESVENYITSHSLEQYKIFVATDEKSFLETIKAVFPHAVVAYDATRSSDGKPLHYNRPDADLSKQGEEALIDCLLLSKGNVLIRTSSHLSLWATFFNPYLPVIQLSAH